MVQDEETTVETLSSLQELTGQESGIVIYYGEGRPEAVICNWSSVNGLPRLDPFGVSVLGLGERFERVEGEGCDPAVLLEGVEIVYSNGEDMPERAKLYRLEEHIAVVLAPEGWA
jgi:hypothetical protein